MSGKNIIKRDQKKMIKKLICYLRGHQPYLWPPYGTFMDDGIIKVSIGKHSECRRCGIKLLRDIESYEWDLIASGKAVVRE